MKKKEEEKEVHREWVEELSCTIDLWLFYYAHDS